MSLIGKTIASTVNGIVITEDTTNGIGTSLGQIKSGNGNSSSLHLSDDNLKVTPENDDTTTVISVTDKDSNALLTVDSSNDLVKAGIGQHNVNTQYAHFGISNADSAWAGCLADTHYAVPFGGMGRSRINTIANLAFGTGTDLSLIHI